MDTPKRAATVTSLFVGIDVSKAALDVALRPGADPWRCANDEPGITELVSRLKPLEPLLIVLEATGGLERLVVAALALAGLPVAVVNPRQVRDFAKATGRLAKTDALDAAALAPCAEAIRPDPRPLPDAQSARLAARVERRRQLVGRLTAEKNRLHQALPAVRPHLAAHSAWRQQALKDLDGERDALLQARPLWRTREQLLRSVPGVGPQVARTLLAQLPEWGQTSAQHLATLLGVAPLTRESATWRGTRAIWGGRRHVRAALDLAALVGVRHNPILRAFYQRLLAAGKPKQLALTACMHKLLLILNAMLRHGTSWAGSAVP